MFFPRLLILYSLVFLFFCSTLCLSVGAASSLLVGVNIDPENTQGGNPPASMVHGSGAALVRLEFKDNSTSGLIPDETFQFYDPIIQSYGALGIQVLVIIDYMTLQTVPWGKIDNSSWTPYIQQLGVRASQIAAHYQNDDKFFCLGSQQSTVIGYEIWNEEDLQQTLVPAEIYAYLLKATYSAIKAASNDNNIKVVVGGLASGIPGYVSQVASVFSGTLYADGLGLHPYGQRPTPDWPSSSWGFGVLGDLLESYAAVTSIPLWITEIGTNDMSVQGDFPEHAFAALEQLPENVLCPVALWFCWSDGMVPPFGLLDQSNIPKPSYYSFTNFTSFSMG